MVRVAFIKGYGMKREGYFRHPAKGRSDELFVVHVIIVTIRNSTCCSAASTSATLKPTTEVARRRAGHGWCDLRHPLQCKGHGMISASRQRVILVGSHWFEA